MNGIRLAGKNIILAGKNRLSVFWMKESFKNKAWNQVALSLKVPQYRLKYIESSSVKNISADILENYIDYLGTVLAAYKKFETGAGSIKPSRGAKTAIIIDAIKKNDDILELEKNIGGFDMGYKKLVFLGLMLGLFFVNVLYATEYKTIKPKELQIDKKSLEGKKLMFQDILWGYADIGQVGSGQLPKLRKYIFFRTRSAGICLLKKENKALLMDIDEGDKIIVYGQVKSWNVGYGLRYDFFVDNIKEVSSGEKPYPERRMRELKIMLNFAGKDYELKERKIYKLKCPHTGKNIELSFEEKKD